MILLDTVALLRIVAGEAVRSEARVAIGRAVRTNGLLLSAVSAWEYDTLARRTGRTSLLFGPTPKQWFVEALKTLPLRLIGFEFDDALALQDLPPGVHRDPADRMLIASARRRQVPIVTDDSKIVKLAKTGVVEVIVC